MLLFLRWHRSPGLSVRQSVTLPEIPIGATCFHIYFEEENRENIVEIIAQLHEQV